MAHGDAAKPQSPSASAPRSSLAFVRTLLWKNWMLKRRHPVATLFELALPCIYILVMGQLKGLVDDVDVPAGWSDDGDADEDGSASGDGVAQGESYNLFSTFDSGTPRYLFGETTLWGLLLFMGSQSVTHGVRMDELTQAALDVCRRGVVRDGRVDTSPSSPFRVPEACGGKVAPYKLAIAPDTAFTREYFLQTMDAWYPRIDVLNGTLQIPSLRESVVFYDSGDALADYVRSSDYGSGLDKPRIFAGIVFDTFPQDAADIGRFQTIEYTLRLNSTRSRGGFLVGNIPRTYGNPPALDPFEKALVRTYYPRYASTGFMTLQTLVTRFVNCMPAWDADALSTNGTCQGAQPSLSTSSSSSLSSAAAAASELDNRLLESLRKDVLIQRMLRTVSDGSDMQMADFLPLLSTETREALLTPLRQAPQPYLGATVAPFPIDRYTSSPFYEQVSNVFAIVFILSYLYSISRILLLFIQEKELRLREFMKILGVRESAIIASWYITYVVILFIGAVLQAAAGTAGLFATSSMTVVFVFFFLFGLSVLAYGFLVSAFFSRSRLGAFVGVVLFFLMYFVSAAFTTDSPEASQNAGCLLSPVALALGVNVFANLESTRIGVSWSNISTLSDNFRLSTALWMFAIDAVLYTVLGLYFDKVIPKEHGTTLPWYFPVSPSYWRAQRPPLTLSESSRTSQEQDGDGGSPSPGASTGRRAADALLDDVVLDVNPNFEPVSNELREQERQGEALSLQRLRKVFPVPGGERVAVKDLSLAMYKSQITCLLGHNGAGKTTLLSMLTGMSAPTSGNATFRGLSVARDMDKLRESLGICFQHDVLFSELTVEEHLRFFGRIKGFRGAALRAAVDTQIREVGLTEKRHARASALSGGMKRKLSVAVSLLGDSSLVFLDEPTSGMDPYSRRSTWEILLNNRSGRVMVLTTHFMDEADILGDRIAIMAEGELRCCGSSLFLKNRFGAGYTLTLVKRNATATRADSDVMAFISSHVPSARVLSNVGSEMAFQLPLASSPRFAAMFAALDDRLPSLGLLSYGVSVTTLEEVFIKVAEAEDESQQHTLDKRPQPDREVPEDGDEALPDTVEPAPKAPLRRRPLFGAHLRALILKRFRVARRDKKAIVYSTALPILLLLIGLGILRGANFTDDDPSLPLSTAAYAQGEASPTPFFCQPSALETASWCERVLLEHYSGAAPQQVSLPQPAYASSSPTVFGVTYTAPALNASDATGYQVRFAQAVYERGYVGEPGGGGGPPVEGQYGAYHVYGEQERGLFGYNVLVNTSSTHAPAIFKALLDQALYRFFATGASASGDASAAAPTVDLVVRNHPLPLTASTQALFGSFLAFSACLFICIAFTFFPASIVVFLVKEKQAEHNAKHQQLVSGVSLGAFWLANLVFDYLVYLVPCACGLALIQLFGISSMAGGADCVTCTPATFPAVVALFLAFGLAICPFNYCLSFLFQEHASSQSYTIIINFLLGVVLMVVSFMLDVIEETQAANAVLVFFWRLSPLFNLGHGLMTLVLTELEGVLTTSGETASPWSADVMGFEILYLLVTALLYSALAIGTDYALTYPRVKHWLAGSPDVEDAPVDDDADVAAEARRVASAGGAAAGDVVVLHGLRKVYKGGKVAVRELSFGLPRGECFGFLGINGAGKTTTLKMLTGDVLSTRGAATLNGLDVLSQQMEVRRQVGYCPQFDALFELLTVREHLELFAALKGVPRAGQALARAVDAKLRQLNLGDFEHKLAGSLSGGNKRKLSVAIAMVGDPPLLFLDEPSTGMDPVSRRFMWDVISDVSTRGRKATVVLTTHSMEEAEALCSRAGVMVGGRLRCLGSIQHLKSRFGDGLVLDVKLRAPASHEVDTLMAEHRDHRRSGMTSARPDEQETDARDERVTAEEVEDECRAFGDAGLASRVHKAHPTGYSLAAALERDGAVRAAALWSWCAEEKRFDALHAYLRREFGGGEGPDGQGGAGVEVLERQNDFCRFKVRGGGAGAGAGVDADADAAPPLRLSTVFARIEAAKDELHVREYSVSQTTLEQIFNFFAAQQQEERGGARGLFR